MIICANVDMLHIFFPWPMIDRRKWRRKWRYSSSPASIPNEPWSEDSTHVTLTFYLLIWKSTHGFYFVTYMNIIHKIGNELQSGRTCGTDGRTDGVKPTYPLPPTPNNFVVPGSGWRGVCVGGVGGGELGVGGVCGGGNGLLGLPRISKCQSR